MPGRARVSRRGRWGAAAGARPGAAGGVPRARLAGVRYNYTVGKTAAFINIKQTTRALWRTVQHP